MRFTKILVSAFLFLLVLPTQVAGAQTGGSGLQISPLKTELTIDPGTSKSFEVKVSNVTGNSVTAEPKIYDFVATDDGGAKPLLDGEKSNTPSIKSFITDLKSITIAKDQSQDVKFNVNVPANQAPGAYWGVIIYNAKTQAENSTDDSGGKVALSAGVGHIVLIQVSGKVTEKLQLVSMNAARQNKTGSIFSSAPEKLQVRVKNTGSGFVQPFGKIAVSKNGKEIHSIELNNSDPRGNVLPNSERVFSEDLKNMSGFGRYTILANISYGKGGDIITQQINFWVLPSWVLVTGAVAVLAVLGGGIFVAQKFKKRK